LPSRDDGGIGPMMPQQPFR